MKQLFLLLILTSICFSSEQIKNVSKEHCQKGLEYYKINEPEKAKSEFLKALETDNSDETSKLMLAALEKEVFKEEPDDSFRDVTKEIYLKGLAFYRAGEKEKALLEWEKGLSVNPKNRQLQEFSTLARAGSTEIPADAGEKKAKERKKPAKKEGKTEKTITVKEDDPAPKPKKSVDEKKVSDLYYEGLKLYRQGDIKKAVEIWEQMLKLDPNLSKARKNLLEKAKKELQQGE